MGGHCANDDMISICGDGIEPGYSANIDDVVRFGEPHLHQRQQALPAGENLHVVFVGGEKIYRFIKRARSVVFKRSWDHKRFPIAKISTRAAGCPLSSLPRERLCRNVILRRSRRISNFATWRKR